MHDPNTVAFEIYLGRKQKKNGRYRNSFITIWHKDPETDNTDDSCGWFIRPRHANQEVLKKIQKEFDYNFKHNYWFDQVGLQIFSTSGTLMLMYRTAAWIHFNYNRKKTDAFMRKHCWGILISAENPTDCMGDGITAKFYISTNTPLLKEDRFSGMAGMVYSDILRKERKWYQHPKWHIHHWRIQFHPFQNLKRRYWDKCCICGKRGFKSSAIGDWGGKRIWHQECDTSTKHPSPTITQRYMVSYDSAVLPNKFQRFLRKLGFKDRKFPYNVVEFRNGIAVYPERKSRYNFKKTCKKLSRYFKKCIIIPQKSQNK